MENGDDKYNPAMIAEQKKAAEQFDPATRAAAKLGSAEEAASNGLYRPSGGTEGVRTEESQPAGLYKGVGKTEKTTGKNGKGKFKGFLKKRGATIGLCIALTFGAGGIMAGTQLFQPFSLVAQFQESFNSMHVSANVRSARFFKAQMSTGRYKDPIGNATIFGSKFKISNKQQAELKQYGIEVDNDFNGSGTKVLKWTNSDGEIQIITADSKTKITIPEVDADTGVKYKAETVDFKTLYASDTDFFHAYNTGSMTWRGQFANWFGKNVDNFLKNNNLTRNLWNNYKNKKAEAGGDGLKVVKETLNERIKGNDGEIDLETKEQDTAKDADGNEVQDADGKAVPATDEDGKPILKDGTTKETVSGTNVSEKLNKIKTKFSQAVNAGCAVMNVVGAISLMVSAAEALQIVNLVTSYMETVDKTKAGYGDEAPINELATSLNEKKNNTNKQLVSTGNSTEVTESGITALETKTITNNKSAMESAGVSALYGNGKVDTSDASVQSFNLTSSMKRILGGIGVSMTAFTTCNFAKGAVAVVGAITDGLQIAACIAGVAGAVFTFGASTAACSGLVVEAVKSLAKSVAIGIVLGGVIATLTPVVSSALERDLVSDLGGEDLGNALTSGALRYMGSAHRANGGSLGTAEKYQQYAVAQAEVVAQDAKEERLTLSPFDITSKNTFMGTILTQMMTLTNSSGLMKSLTSASTAMSSSIASLTPRVSAVTKTISESLPTEEEYAETCPYLASIGAVGDAFCNPYVVTDMSTIEMDPYDVIKQLYTNNQVAVVDSEGQEVAAEDLDKVTFAVAELSDSNIMKLADTEDEEVVNVKVKDGTELAKYIKYCGTRESDFGFADQNIVNDFNSSTSVNSGSSIVDSAGNGAIGAIPVFGDIIDIVESVKTEANLGYVSGENCVANSSSSDWNNEFSLYQRFSEDQSLAESMGIIEKSAVAEYLEEYYEQNPVDNSYEGILARYSGMEKETVSDLLDVIAYYEYVNEYDPSERYAFEGATDPNESEPILLDNEYVLAGDVNLPENIIYADIRNRSFAV